MAIVNDFGGQSEIVIGGDVGGTHKIGQIRLGWQYFIKQNLTGFKFIACNGRLGRPNGLGLIKPGWSKLGEWNPKAGIFRRDGRWKKQRIIKQVHYRPTNPRTDLQQFYRDYFRYSTLIYHAFDTETLAYLHTKGTKYSMTGYNYFISQYSLKKPANIGNYRCGFTKLGVLTNFRNI